MKFEKYSGCGNDFILIDNRRNFFPTDNPSFVREMCHRKQGIGADGVILLENSGIADFRMKIFNADGSQAEMCGNGIRCLVRFIEDLGFHKELFVIETMERCLKATSYGDVVSIDMGAVKNINWDCALDVEGTLFSGAFLNTGVPHFVYVTKDIDSFNLLHYGPLIRNHTHFGPNGTNVNVAEILPDRIRVRTFERGVEDETLACGTGATAVAITAAKKAAQPSPITVEVKSGELLKIAFSFDEMGEPTSIIMTGRVKKIFEGYYNPNKISI